MLCRLPVAACGHFHTKNDLSSGEQRPCLGNLNTLKIIVSVQINLGGTKWIGLLKTRTEIAKIAKSKRKEAQNPWHLGIHKSDRKKTGGNFEPLRRRELQVCKRWRGNYVTKLEAIFSPQSLTARVVEQELIGVDILISAHLTIDLDIKQNSRGSKMSVRVR